MAELQVRRFVSDGVLDYLRTLDPEFDTIGANRLLEKLWRGLPWDKREEVKLYIKQLQIPDNAGQLIREGQLHEAGKLYLALRRIALKAVDVKKESKVTTATLTDPTVAKP